MFIVLKLTDFKGKRIWMQDVLELILKTETILVTFTNGPIENLAVELSEFPQDHPPSDYHHDKLFQHLLKNAWETKKSL